jgi:hypothetical protein
MAGKVGRPKKAKNDTKAPGISVRLNPAERRAVETAIKKSRLRQSEWVRKALLHAAQNDILLT